MIAVDTSALMAILLNEAEADACAGALAAEDRVVMSAATMAEALIVAGRRGLAEPMVRLIQGLDFEIAPVTAEVAARAAEVYARWGRGVDPAALNFGDCFAYDAARSAGCPLLFVGGDFARTDIGAVL